MEPSDAWYFVVAVLLVLLLMLIGCGVSGIQKSWGTWQTRQAQAQARSEFGVPRVSYDSNRASVVYSHFFEAERAKIVTESSIHNTENGGNTGGATPTSSISGSLRPSSYPSSPAMAAQLYESLRCASAYNSGANTPQRLSHDMTEAIEMGYGPYFTPYHTSGRPPSMSQSSRISFQSVHFSVPPLPKRVDSEAGKNDSGLMR